jgi:hypothetical protein
MVSVRLVKVGDVLVITTAAVIACGRGCAPGRPKAAAFLKAMIVGGDVGYWGDERTQGGRYVLVR